jgi:AcrR family transcriptional regulator
MDHNVKTPSSGTPAGTAAGDTPPGGTLRSTPPSSTPPREAPAGNTTSEDTPPVAKRHYHSPRRIERAGATRHAVLTAARELFVGNGYAATTVAEIADRAGVSVDTVYATVGRKPALLRELVETAVSGTGQAVPAEQRDYVTRIHAAAAAREKLTIYAFAITEIQQRLAPVFLALRAAATTDSDCANLWAEIADRRATNMLTFATELRQTGQIRDDLTDTHIADIIWSMNAAEYWALLVQQRSWTPTEFAHWLTDAWTRVLLA